jgi:hypothetical protein
VKRRSAVTITPDDIPAWLGEPDELDMHIMAASNRLMPDRGVMRMMFPSRDVEPGTYRPAFIAREATAVQATRAFAYRYGNPLFTEGIPSRVIVQNDQPHSPARMYVASQASPEAVYSLLRQKWGEVEDLRNRYDPMRQVMRDYSVVKDLEERVDSLEAENAALREMLGHSSDNSPSLGGDRQPNTSSTER